MVWSGPVRSGMVRQPVSDGMGYMQSVSRSRADSSPPTSPVRSLVALPVLHSRRRTGWETRTRFGIDDEVETMTEAAGDGFATCSIPICCRKDGRSGRQTD